MNAISTIYKKFLGALELRFLILGHEPTEPPRNQGERIRYTKRETDGVHGVGVDSLRCVCLSSSSRGSFLPRTLIKSSVSTSRAREFPSSWLFFFDPLGLLLDAFSLPLTPHRSLACIVSALSRSLGYPSRS